MALKYSVVKDVRDSHPVGQESTLRELAERIRGSLKVGEKYGEGICAGTFRAGTRGRKKENVERMHSLILDIDHGLPGDRIDDFLGIWPWQGIAYTSYSHTPEEPRFRVILPFAYPIDGDAYATVWKWANERSGEVIDQKCKNTDRLYFLPRVPSADALENAWVREINGDAELLDPLEQVLRWMILKGEGRNNSFHWLACRLQELEWRESDIIAKVTPLQREFRDAGNKEPYTEKELQDSVASARSAAGKKKTKGKRRPNDMARQVMGEHKLTRDPNGLMFEWDGICWKPLTRGVLTSYSLSADTHGQTTRARRDETSSYVMATVQRTEEIPWGNLDEHEVPVSDGVLNVETKDLRPHKPEDWVESVVPHTWSPDDECELWLDSLETWFGGCEDKEKRIAALQEFFGYSLVKHARYKCALVLYGEKSDTGKSVVAGVMSDLVGRENTCNISVEVMHDPRQIAPIRGKALNVISELTAQAMISDAGFKRLVSSGEDVMIDEKFERPVLYQPHCVHVITTNILPRCTDETRATYRRLLLLHFGNQVPLREQDPDLGWKLKHEMPGILAWSVEGARRLVTNNGRFTAVPSSIERIEEYRKDQNPIFAFLDERCYEDEEREMEFRPAHKAFCDWYNKPIAASVFGRWLKSAEIEVERRREGRQQLRYIQGYALVDGLTETYGSAWNG